MVIVHADPPVTPYKFVVLTWEFPYNVSTSTHGPEPVPADAFRVATTSEPVSAGFGDAERVALGGVSRTYVSPSGSLPPATSTGANPELLTGIAPPASGGGAKELPRSKGAQEFPANDQESLKLPSELELSPPTNRMLSVIESQVIEAKVRPAG